MQCEKENNVWLKSLMYNNKKLVTLNIQAWIIFNPFQKNEKQLNNIQDVEHNLEELSMSNWKDWHITLKSF
jgi:hypothetical protein